MYASFVTPQHLPENHNNAMSDSYLKDFYAGYCHNVVAWFIGSTPGEPSGDHVWHVLAVDHEVTAPLGW